MPERQEIGLRQSARDKNELSRGNGFCAKLIRSALVRTVSQMGFRSSCKTRINALWNGGRLSEFKQNKTEVIRSENSDRLWKSPAPEDQPRHDMTFEKYVQCCFILVTAGLIRCM